MSAIRYYKQIGISILIVLVSAPGSGISAGERTVPVLERTDSGILVSGRSGEAAPEIAGRQRVLSFDWGPAGGFRAGRRGLLGAERSAVDTWRVLLIRISFETDRDDALSSVPENGNFDLTPGGAQIIDPTPHNRSYFDAHMQGLRNYYQFQSCGRLEITWEILPSGEKESYKLSDVADYGPGSSGMWTTRQLVRFFRNSVEAADSALERDGYPFHIGDFDALVIAHAGANLQSDIDFDTPNDIPSFFARLGEEDEFTVDGGATVINQGSVIPETAAQDGYTGGIAAVLAHEFGHALGLPDLYNIYNNAAAVGVWDNMDSGGMLGVYIVDEEDNYYYVEGIIPGGLSAWSRTLMGWTDVDTVETFRNSISLPAVEKCPARVVRVDASEDEYFLVENRAAELDGLLTGFVVDTTTGVIIGTGNCLNCDGTIPPQLEWELVNGYDALLPTEYDVASYDGGPGILIWHIDERLISERWEDNSINSVFPFAVSLLEANGVVDLGDPYSYFGWGWHDDAYYAGNNTTLSDSTLPASWSNRLVPTGVRIEGITSRDTLMRFGAGVRDIRAKEAVGPEGRFTPASGGALQLPGTYRTLIVDDEGTGWIAGTGVPVFSLGNPTVMPPALAPGFDMAAAAVIVGEKRGIIHAYRDDDWTEFDGWPYSLGASLSTHPVVVSAGYGTFIAAADAAGRMHMTGADGQEATDVGFPIYMEPSLVLGNLVAAADSLGEAIGIFCLSGGIDPAPNAWLSYWDISSGDITAGENYAHRIGLTEKEIQGDIALVGGDVNPLERGVEVYIVSLDTGRIILCGRDGILAGRTGGGRVATLPAVGDLNGDSYLELVYSDGETVYAINPSGANLTGWPRRLSELYYIRGDTRVSAPIITIDTPSGGIVVAGTDAGIVYVFDHRGGFVSGYPRKISSSFGSTVDIVSVDGEGLFAYQDYFSKEGDYPSPGVARNGGSFKWRLAPFDPEGQGFSWAGVWGGASRTAFAQPSGRRIDLSGEWINLANNLVVYPNPSNGERIGFHFNSPDAGSAYLEIMTIGGELVTRRNKQLNGGEDEFVVSMSGRASGVYLCRLVVTSGGRRVEAYRKFAIVN